MDIYKNALENFPEAVFVFGENLEAEFLNGEAEKMKRENKNAFSTIKNLGRESFREKKGYSIRFSYKSAGVAVAGKSSGEEGKRESFVLARSAYFESGGRPFVLVSAADVGDLMKTNHVYRICSNCKDVEAKPSEWQKAEIFINANLAAIRFSHTICPRCREKLYPREK